MISVKYHNSVETPSAVFEKKCKSLAEKKFLKDHSHPGYTTILTYFPMEINLICCTVELPDTMILLSLLQSKYLIVPKIVNLLYAYSSLLCIHAVLAIATMVVHIYMVLTIIIDLRYVSSCIVLVTLYVLDAMFVYHVLFCHVYCLLHVMSTQNSILWPK